jgi:GT2 family glycosyltransferase
MNVDLIVLVHNRLDVTRRFFDALKLNPSNNLRSIVVIDNGSNEETSSYLFNEIGARPDVRVFRSESNIGVIEGRNLGWSKVKDQDVESGVMFLDNDQIVRHGWLDSHIEFLRRNSYDLVGVEAWKMSDDFRPIRKCNKSDRTFTYVGCGGMLMRKKVPLRIGMFDSRFSPAYFEDPDFNIRALASGFRIGWNTDRIVDHEEHSTLRGQDWKNHFRSSYLSMVSKWQGRVVLPELRT